MNGGGWGDRQAFPTQVPGGGQTELDREEGDVHRDAVRAQDGPLQGATEGAGRGGEGQWRPGAALKDGAGQGQGLRGTAQKRWPFNCEPPTLSALEHFSFETNPDPVEIVGGRPWAVF